MTTMDAPRAPPTTSRSGPGSPGSRPLTFGSVAAPYTSKQDDGQGRRYSTSPSADRKAADRYGGGYGEPSGLAELLDPATNSTPPASILLLRNLSATMTREGLNTMLIFASDLIDARFLEPQQQARYQDDQGFQTAVARFATVDGALEVKNKLHGKANGSGDATMVAEVIKGAMGTGAAPGRRPSDGRHLSGSNSSGGSSNGIGRSRFSTTFQSLDMSSPTARQEMPNIFASTSPSKQLKTSRLMGQSTIDDDDAAENDTRDLLYNSVAYPDGGSRSRHGSLPLSQLAGLRLDTDDRNGSMSGATGFRGLPVQSPGVEYSQPFGMSPVSPTSTYGSPPFRQQFPPANPADQNPPCNTLYVGNLPMDTVEEELKDLFSKQRGYKRLCFRTKHNGPMCFVEFEDVSFATKALNELYGTMLSNSVRGGIRLSFSKNPLGVRAGQSAVQSPTSPTGYGAALPGGFSSASGPPPGLSMPPGLSSMGAAEAQAQAQAYYAASPTHVSPGPFSSHNGPLGYGQRGYNGGSFSGVSARR